MVSELAASEAEPLGTVALPINSGQVRLCDALADAIETTRIHRIAGLTGDRTALVTIRPFRAPHHTISDAGLDRRGPRADGGGGVTGLPWRALPQ